MPEDVFSCAAPYWPGRFADEVEWLNWQWRLEQIQKANKKYDRIHEKHAASYRIHRQRLRAFHQQNRKSRGPERIKHARQRGQAR